MKSPTRDRSHTHAVLFPALDRGAQTMDEDAADVSSRIETFELTRQPKFQCRSSPARGTMEA